MPTPLPLCNGHPSHDSMFLLPHQLFEPSTPTAFISSMSKVTHSPLTTPVLHLRVRFLHRNA